jgi:hypothetical protein
LPNITPKIKVKIKMKKKEGKGTQNSSRTMQYSPNAKLRVKIGRRELGTKNLVGFHSAVTEAPNAFESDTLFP